MPAFQPAKPCTLTSLASVVGHDLTCPNVRLARLRGLNAIDPRRGWFLFAILDSSIIFYNELAPPRGAYEGAYSVEAVTRSPIPTSGERSSWDPRGMAQCVWLLTFEQPSDLPPVYMRFGLTKEKDV